MAPRNPFLADSYATLTHFDSAQTDAVDLPAPVGVHQIENADARWVPGGLVNISFQVMPPLADGTQYALAANSQQVAKIRIDDNRFELIDLLPLPNHADADQRQYKCRLHHDRRKSRGDDRGRWSVAGRRHETWMMPYSRFMARIGRLLRAAHYPAIGGLIRANPSCRR